MTVPSFSERSFLRYDSPTNIHINTVLTMSFIPTAHTGLLLYLGNVAQNQDFLSLSLINQYVELRYDLGSGPVVIVSNQPVSLGACHTLSVVRMTRSATLTVDQSDIQQGQSQRKSAHLNAAGDLFVGGVESFSSVSASAGTEVGLSGCVTSLEVSVTLNCFRQFSAIHIVNFS